MGDFEDVFGKLGESGPLKGESSLMAGINRDLDRVLFVDDSESYFDGREAPDEVPNRALVTTMIREYSDLASYKPEIMEIAAYFDRMVAVIGAENSRFFENEKLEMYFIERLRAFSMYLDEEITKLKVLLKGNDECRKFSKNWERNVRRAAYYAFFIHFGAKRRGETDDKGKMKDYVYHVVRSGFNCLMRKMRFFDEKSLLTNILHDSKEDYEKGFLAVISNDNINNPWDIETQTPWFKPMVKEGASRLKGKKKRIFDEFHRFTRSLESGLGELSDPGELTIAELVHIVTKKTNDRNRALVDLFYRIVNFPSGKKRFSALRALMVKMADRLDNIKSLAADPGSKKAESKEKHSSAIEDETVYFFLLLSKKFRMVNIAEWFRDYLHVKDNKKRKKVLALRKNENQKYNRDERERDLYFDDDYGSDDDLSYTGIEGLHKGLLEEFEEEFRYRMVAAMRGQAYDPFMANSYNYGRDFGTVGSGINYILSPRGIGMRYEDEMRAQFHAGEGIYSRGFLHYLIFHPVGNNPQLAEIARKVFRDIFEYNAKDLIREGSPASDRLRSFLELEINRGELHTELGQIILRHGSDPKFSTNNFSFRMDDSDDEDEDEYAGDFFNGYGVGVWGVFDSQREAVHDLLGDLHLAFFYDDDEANGKKREIDDSLEKMAPHISRMQRLYDEFSLPDYEEGKHTPEEIETRKKLDKVLDPYTPEQRQCLYRVLSYLVMTMFMEKRKTATNVIVNGGNNWVDLPVDCDVATALVFAKPLLLGKNGLHFKSIDDDTPISAWRDPVEQHFIFEGTAMGLLVNERAPFNRKLLERQIRKIVNDILPKFREELMKEGMPKHTDDL